jgi:hypothetical protein
VRVLAFLLSLLWVSHPLQGQLPRVTTAVDTTLVTVGDRITLRVSVLHSSSDQVEWPDSLDLRPFEILDARLSPPVQLQGDIESSLTLTLTVFELGDLEIPGFSVEVVDPEGERTSLPTNPFGIQVSSVGLDEGGDIRDLRGPLWIPMAPGRVALFALLVVLGLGALYALYRWAKRRKPEDAPGVSSLPLRPPHEIALEALDRLEVSPLLERGEVKEFHIQLSDILRSYAEGEFGVPALEMTTGDLMAGMAEAGIEEWIAEAFRDFLTPCDMVKFAKLRPGAEEARHLLDQGRRLVEDTHKIPSPVEEPPESGPGDSPEPTLGDPADQAVGESNDDEGGPSDEAPEDAPEVAAV